MSVRSFPSRRSLRECSRTLVTAIPISPFHPSFAYLHLCLLLSLFPSHSSCMSTPPLFLQLVLQLVELQSVFQEVKARNIVSSLLEGSTHFNDCVQGLTTSHGMMVSGRSCCIEHILHPTHRFPHLSFPFFVCDFPLSLLIQPIHSLVSSLIPR